MFGIVTWLAISTPGASKSPHNKPRSVDFGILITMFSLMGRARSHARCPDATRLVRAAEGEGGEVGADSTHARPSGRDKRRIIVAQRRHRRRDRERRGHLRAARR